MRIPRGAIALATVLATCASTGAAFAAQAAPGTNGTALNGAALDNTALNTTDGRGATVPFTQYGATDPSAASTNGTVIGPSDDFGTLASEAIGRTAVTLSGPGRYVEFTLARAANAVDVHESIPDSPDGSPYTAPLSVYVDGRYDQSLTLTNKYSWFYGNYPFTNDPADGKGHHFYDDVRTTFGRTLPAGTKVRLRVDDGATPVTVDVADFEQIAAPAHRPGGSLSVLDFGADPTGRADSTAAIQNAINAGSARHRTVWIPAGTFSVTGHLIVDDVTVRGAGPWYSVLTGPDVGVYGNFAPTPSANVHLSDFAIFGEITDRDDSAQVNGIGGALGGGSTIDDLWIEHTKVGMWFDGPFDGLAITDTRIQDTTADGVNFHDGISHATVSGTYVRNTGDDGLAMWSGGEADYDNAFIHDTVALPILANNIAIYGGHDNAVTGDVVTDTLTQGGGIHVGNRFGAVPLSGTTTIAHNTLIRTGVLDPNWLFGVGALWFYALDEPMTATIDAHDDAILDSPYEAVQFIGSTITNVNLDHVAIDGAGTFAVQQQAAGSASFAHVTATGLGAGGIYDCGSGFAITRGPGNHGWGDTHCGFPPDGVLVLNTSSLFLGVTDPGTTAPSAPVTVTNPGPNPAAIASIRAGGDFTQTNDCGAQLAVGATCTVSVSFTPSATGDRSGLLTVASNTPFSPYTVSLSGVGYDPNGNLALGRTMTASSYTAGFPPSFVNDANPNTYWESQDGAFPQTLTADLGSAVSTDRIVLRLPPTWGARTETVAIDSSADGTTYAPLVASTGYTFDPTTFNDVTIAYPATSARYLRLTLTGNTGWPAAQISEFEIYAH
jgi:alpha-1,3-glucanase-like protein/F5/8 type C domain-containing protein/HYDIN/CFA65/VesB family protein